MTLQNPKNLDNGTFFTILRGYMPMGPVGGFLDGLLIIQWRGIRPNERLASSGTNRPSCHARGGGQGACLSQHPRCVMVSSEPAAMKHASGKMAMLVTPVSMLGSSSIGSTFESHKFMPHIRAVLSSKPETMSTPSCEKSSK